MQVRCDTSFKIAEPTRKPVGGPVPTCDRAALCALLDGLFQKQLALEPNNVYLLEHCQPRNIENHVRTFQWYESYLPVQGDVLEWGCQHAPDSCLLRARQRDDLRLHACDILAPNRYQHFHEFAGFEYRQLHDLVKMPYESNSLDAVIASGVLEHVAMDYESLKEVHRILKPGAPLIITYLPNWLSLAEWKRRVIWRNSYHQRRYGVGETNQLLKRSGFVPRYGGQHTFFWERLLGRVGLGGAGGLLPRLMSTLLPVHCFCATLRFVAVKSIYM